MRGIFLRTFVSGIGMIIFDLKTDGQVRPLGIDRSDPRFTWKFSAGNVFQTWYRVCVASSEEALAAGKPDLWDSGCVRTCRQSALYGGKPLQSLRVYYWSVETNVGRAESCFETAYIGTAMPRAVWIGMPMAYQGATDLVRLDFTPPQKVRRARLYLAALGCCRCYLNGELVGDDYFDGAVSAYGKRVFYRARELHVREGNNALCVELGYGFYGAKKMCAEVFLEYEDGTTTIIPTLAGRVWNISAGRVAENSVYGGEVFDARISFSKYLPAHPVSTDEFVAAYCVEPPAGRLCSCPIPPMRVVEAFPPAEMRKQGEGAFVDIGKNICGWLKLRVRGERGAKVTVYYAELLGKDGEISRTNLRTARSRDVYILSGEGEEVYAPAFTYHGFRYAEIRTEGRAEVLGALAQHVRSDLEVCGSFTCSDSQLNALHEMAALTESNNLNGVFTDCPQRDERLAWLNDMSARIFEAVCNFDLSAFLPNFVNMITDTQTESGAIGDTVPFSVGSAVADAVDAYPLLGWLAYQLYGDERVLAENYDGFCRWNDCLSKYEKGGVVEWGIYGDWCPAFAFSKGGDGTHSAMVTPQFMAGAFYLWNLSFTEKIAHVLGKTADEKRWRTCRLRGKDAFFRRYLNAATGTIGGGSQTECAVAMTVFPEERALCEGWAKAAAQDIAARGYHMTCGNQGYRPLFYRLAEYGYGDVLLKLLKNEEYPGWGYMLVKGATTVWERWESDVYTDMHSFDHPMFAGYDGFLYNFVAGIRTRECEDAFGEIVVEPLFSLPLKSVSARLDTVRGPVCVAWEKRGGKIVLRVSVPGNTRLTVRAKGKLLRIGELCGEDCLRLTNGEFVIEAEERAAVCGQANLSESAGAVSPVQSVS